MKKFLKAIGFYNYRSLIFGLVGCIAVALFIVWNVTTNGGTGKPLPDYPSVKIGIIIFSTVWAVLFAAFAWGLWSLSRDKKDGSE
jgi:hypothetical protein